jgi:hypothetical protein
MKEKFPPNKLGPYDMLNLGQYMAGKHPQPIKGRKR